MPFQIVMIYAVLIVCSCLFIVPLLWMLSTSVKPMVEAFRVPPALLPTHWEWGNYVTAVTKIPFLHYTVNTLFVTTLSVIGALLSSSAVASLGKIDWCGRKIITA